MAEERAVSGSSDLSLLDVPALGPAAAPRKESGGFKLGGIGRKLTQGRNRRIVFSASAGAVQRVLQAACTLLIMPLLIKVLGPAQFGVWGAAASLAWLAGFVDLGVGSALVTLVAEATTLHRDEDARHHVTGAMVIGGGLGTLILIAAAMTPALQAKGGVYLIAAVGVAANIPLNGANSVWLALQEGYVAGFWELFQTLLTTAGLLAATLVSRDVRVYVAMVYGGLVLANLGSLAHLMLQHPELRPSGLVGIWKAVRRLATKGMLFWALSVAGGLSYLLDNVFALQLLGPEASARMTVALRICMTAAGVLAVISQPLWPAFTEAAAKADMPWIRRCLVHGVLVLVGTAAAGAIFLLTVGGPLLQWWLGPNLGIGRDVLWAMSAWIGAVALARVPTLFLNAISVIHFQVLVIAAGTVGAFALKFLWAPHFGIAGILWGTTLTLLLICPALVWRMGCWARERRGFWESI
jgi:O-antigen/teichoic acid export membrane protein